MKETKGMVTQKGMPIVLLGSSVKVGQKAPDFKLLSMDKKEVTLSDSRAVFIIDKEDTVRYVEYVKEVGQLPDFEAALEVLKQLTAGQPVSA